MKMKNYVIEGITEESIKTWGDSLRNDINIFSISHRGDRKIVILIQLTSIEALKARFLLFLHNRKYNTKISLKSC